MTPHQIVVVVLRLIALVWLLYTLTHVFGLFAVIRGDPDALVSRPIVMFSAAFQVIVCLVLWFFPSTIAANLLRSAPDTETPAPARPICEWQVLGIVFVGLLALARAIPDSIYWVTYAAMATGYNLSFFDLDADQKANALATVFELAIGLTLILGARPVATMLFKDRDAGK
jgi:hypothetical protein